jgi:predicted transcriptional regulator
MTQIPVSEELATSIHALASNHGCSPEELLESLISRMGWDADFSKRVFTRAATMRIHEGIEASLSGEVVSHEEVEAFFDDWERDLQA